MKEEITHEWLESIGIPFDEECGWSYIYVRVPDGRLPPIGLGQDGLFFWGNPLPKMTRLEFLTLLKSFRAHLVHPDSQKQLWLLDTALTNEANR